MTDESASFKKHLMRVYLAGGMECLPFYLHMTIVTISF